MQIPIHITIVMGYTILTDNGIPTDGEEQFTHIILKCPIPLSQTTEEVTAPVLVVQFQHTEVNSRIPHSSTIPVTKEELLLTAM